MTPRELCLEGSKRPEGIRAKDIPVPRTTACKNFAVLVEMGLVFKAGTHLEMRYFSTPERAKAFTAQSATAMAALERRRVRMNRKPTATKAGWGPDDPARITSKTKVTIATTPPQALYSNTYPRY